MTDIPEKPVTRVKPPIVPASVAARMLGRHPRTVRAWILAGKVKGVVVGTRYYVQRDALEILIACK